MLDYISTLQCYGALVLIQLKPGKVEFGTQESRLRDFSPNSRLFLETVQLIFITGSTNVTCIILDLLRNTRSRVNDFVMEGCHSKKQ